METNKTDAGLPSDARPGIHPAGRSPTFQGDIERARILEIGPFAIMKSAFPDRTQLLYTYYKRGEPADLFTPFTVRSGFRAWRDIRAGKFDLIVVWTMPYPPWNFRQLKAAITRPFRPFSSLVRVVGVQMLRFVSTSTPIIAIDNEDPRTIARHNLFLIDKAKYFFKRELPIDRWQVFQHTGHAGMPGPRFRLRARNRRRVEKLRPISIGVTVDKPIPLQAPFPEKTADIFVALGAQGASTVRAAGFRQLRAIAAEGVAVDMPDRRLDRAEYFRRMSQAWLTWSPEGLGWDCFRHYEAPLVYSVPLINTPTIFRYAPLLDGVHACYYAPDDPDSLFRVIKTALGDKKRLRDIAARARAHVLAHHVRPQPFADRILRMGLGYEDPPSGLTLD